MSVGLSLEGSKVLHIRQRKELVEILGFETRNKYEVINEAKEVVGFAAEQGKGFGGAVLRHFLGHWRKFDIHFFDANRQLVFIAHHPFRFFFNRIEVKDPRGATLGAIQKRWAFLTKKFDFEDARGNVIFTCSSPIWKLWTFPVKKNDQEVAMIKKKWAGLGVEAFLDADKFHVEYLSSALSQTERLLILAAGLFVDLVYFEKKASS